jgi:Rieske Fe-S protein
MTVDEKVIDRAELDRRVVVIGASTTLFGLGLLAAACGSAAGTAATTTTTAAEPTPTAGNTSAAPKPPTSAAAAPSPAAPSPAAPRGVPLGKAAAVPVGGGTVFAAAKVVVTQPQAGTYVGLSAICTHQGCVVQNVSGGTINCPCHGSRYHLDGKVARGPAPRALAHRSVTVVNGELELA